EFTISIINFTVVKTSSLDFGFLLNHEYPFGI
ncbi:uncharacterized protein METZ01_LOCUS138396, partial [marine metagenome]